MFRSSKKITVAALGSVLALSLVACGGSSSGTATAAAPNPNATGAPGSGAPGGGNGRGFGNGQGQAEFAKIQACLSAAGISLPTRTNFPRPSGSNRPSGTPGVRPSGADGRRFGGGGAFADPKAQAALKACGITLPTFGPRPSGS